MIFLMDMDLLYGFDIVLFSVIPRIVKLERLGVSDEKNLTDLNYIIKKVGEKSLLSVSHSKPGARKAEAEGNEARGGVLEEGGGRSARDY